MIKAELVELDRQSRRPRQRTRVEVQFNPETLHVSYSPPDGSNTSGLTTLRMQLWFDVSGNDAAAGNADVRRLTARIAYFMTPQAARTEGQPRVRPLVRFEWGTFQFDGTLDALDETLEFFSPDGRPLRASLSLLLSSDHIQFQFAR